MGGEQICVLVVAGTGGPSFPDDGRRRFDVHREPTVEGGLERLADENVRVDCVVSHHDPPECDALAFVDRSREIDPNVPLIVLVDRNAESVAERAIERGATDCHVRTEGGERSGLLANRIRNAVEHRRTERNLERRRQRLETLIDTVPGIVYRSRNEPGWPIEIIEGDCEEITGYRPVELESGRVSMGRDVVHPDDRDRTWAVVQDALENRDDYELTYRIVTADGETRRMRERGRGIYDDGELAALEGFITDVTERTERERERRRNQRRFEAIFEDPKTLVGLLDLDGTLIDANRTAMSYVDADLEELRGTPFWETPWWTTDVRDRVRRWVERAASGEYVDYETDLDRSGGRGGRVSGTVRPVTDDDGEPTSLIASARDITEQRNRNRTLESTRDKLAVLNQVVRHDLRNHMQIVRGRGRLLAPHVDDAGEQHLEEVLLSVEEAIDLTETARELTETMFGDDEQLRPVSVQQVVASVVETAETRYEWATITVDGTDAETTVRADDMFESVVHNLVQNALVHNDSTHPTVEVSIDRRNGSVFVSVADDGPGISNRRKEQVFGHGEKGLESPGTGIGLYLVRTLVEGYGGEVWIEDNEPTGTVVRVQLPVAETAANASRGVSEADSGRNR
ncbi:PAS domain S-box protein [Natrarchaeobius oligotrophus]|nr:PAS domain S-box protein [Natrarchaeobius chitinivorans]